MDENPYQAPGIPSDEEQTDPLRLTAIEVIVWMVLALVVIALVLPARSI